jgi:hypothetical protein
MNVLTRVRLITAAILIVGLGSAIVIYLTAESAGNLPGYDAEDSKQYLRAMELYGGKANLLASELLRCFNGLWHGTRLAFTVACITVVVAGVFWLVSGPEPTPDERSR